MKDDDFIDRLFVANTHDYILCFSSRGRVYWLKVYEGAGGRAQRARQADRQPLSAHGRRKDQRRAAGSSFDDNHFVFMATAEGTVKKTALTAFSNPRKAGIIAVIWMTATIWSGSRSPTATAMSCCSPMPARQCVSRADVRPMGREARGVRGMNLEDGQRVIAMLVTKDDSICVLTATENGYGKRTPVGEYTRHSRGTKGMIAIQTSDRNGKLVGACLVEPTDEVMLISTGGVLIRTKVMTFANSAGPRRA
jgi:DNA gyrase subunit A